MNDGLFTTGRIGQTGSGSFQSFFKNGTSTLSCNYNTGNSTESTVSSPPITITKESFTNTESNGGSDINPVQYSFWNSKTKQIAQVQKFQVYKPPTICSGKFSARWRLSGQYLNLIC